MKAIDFREKQHGDTESPLRSLDDCKIQQSSASLHQRTLKHTETTLQGGVTVLIPQQVCFGSRAKEPQVGLRVGVWVCFGFLHPPLSWQCKPPGVVLCSVQASPVRHAEEELPRGNVGTGVLQKQHSCSTQGKV